MTQAANHADLLNNARTGVEFDRAIEQAKREALAEEYEQDGAISALEFADGSRVAINAADRSASETVTVTVFVQSLRDAACVSEEDDAAFDDVLPGYIARLRAALPTGAQLEINEHDLSTRSLSDNADQDLAYRLSYVEFWN